MARGMKFLVYEVEELYYLCSKNKGADQLCGYPEADLRLCFRIFKKPVFLITRLILSLLSETHHLLGKSCLCGSALEDSCFITVLLSLKTVGYLDIDFVFIL